MIINIYQPFCQMFSAINYLCVSFSFLADTLNIIVDYNKIHKWVYQVGIQLIRLETQVLITLWYFLIPNATDLLLADLGFVNPVMKMVDDVVDTVLQDQKRFILWPKREKLDTIEAGFRVFQGISPQTILLVWILFLKWSWPWLLT